MSYQNILTEKQGKNLIITINREDKLNALNVQTLQEIKAAVIEANSNSEIKGIILTGSGQKAFAAGADIAEFVNFNQAEGSEMSQKGHEVMFSIERSAKPVIAAVNGFALGGGCELAMACHMRVASSNARFGQPEVNLGVIPGYAGTQRLIQLIGKGKATELLLTGDAIKADEALSLGLVNYVVEQNELINKCSEILDKIAQKSPMAIAKTISCINAYFEDGTNGFDFEVKEFGSCFSTPEFKEGTSAFLEKRKANF